MFLIHLFLLPRFALLTALGRFGAFMSLIAPTCMADLFFSAPSGQQNLLDGFLCQFAAGLPITLLRCPRPVCRGADHVAKFPGSMSGCG